MIAAPAPGSQGWEFFLDEGEKALLGIQESNLPVVFSDEPHDLRWINPSAAVKGLMLHSCKPHQLEGDDTVLAAAESDEVALGGFMALDELDRLLDDQTEGVRIFCHLMKSPFYIEPARPWDRDRNTVQSASARRCTPCASRYIIGDPP